MALVTHTGFARQLLKEPLVHHADITPGGAVGPSPNGGQSETASFVGRAVTQTVTRAVDLAQADPPVDTKLVSWSA
jgi:hypothetical protein